MTMLSGAYLGRKGGSGVAEWIINKMPKHDIYIEAFMGCGVISSKKTMSIIDNIGIELDSTLCTELTMRYQNFTIINDDVLKQLPTLLEMSILQKKQICVYLDPPYLPETRTDYAASNYKHELTKEQHIQLLSMLEHFSKCSNIHFLISGYKSELYMSMLESWNYFEFQTMSRGGKRMESLWTNFNPDDFIKHTYDYIGNNFTDRQRIKRKVKRWKDKFNKLLFDEKYVIFKELEKEFKHVGENGEKV